MEDRIDRPTARRMINELKGGTTPLDAVRYLDVGREKWYRGMDYYLDCAEDGESKVRFIRGRYGDGKTHMMGMAQYFALERGFAVSYASAESTRLDKIEELYSRIVKGLQAANVQGGLEFILRMWKEQVADDVEREEARLREVPELDLNFRVAVQAYLREEEADHLDAITKWLHGESIKLREAGISRPLRRGDIHDMMRSLSVFLQLIGYGGLLVLLDELDRILFQSQRVRSNCYQVLRELMDNADGQGGMKGTLFYCAAPSEMFLRDRGFKEYDALSSRIEPAMRGLGEEGRPRRVDYRGTIMNLEDTPLGRDEFLEIARKVRGIHSVALSWDAASGLPDAALADIVDKVLAREYNICSPRLIATTVAIIADITEQGGEYDVATEIERGYDVAEEARSRQHKKYED